MGWFNHQLNKGPQLVTPGDTWTLLHQGLEKTQQALQKRQLEVDTRPHTGWLGHLKGSFLGRDIPLEIREILVKVKYDSIWPDHLGKTCVLNIECMYIIGCGPPARMQSWQMKV